MKPLVTVITVCFNCKSDIEKTIKSVLEQTYDNIEYLIIDGGSTDGTVDVIKTYSDRLAYWVSEPDRGIYDAMNKGLQKAAGEWVNFMNVGDLFVDEMVATDLFLSWVMRKIWRTE
jgi:glycosyltransferase involved in cell wall biosynthesis